MSTVFVLLMLASLVCLIIGLAKPSSFSKLFKKNATRGKLALIFGGAFILFIILIGITAPPTKTDDKKTATTAEVAKTLTPEEQAKKDADDALAKKQADEAKAKQEAEAKAQYVFIKSKTETDENKNKMDLYTYSGDPSLDKLRALCKEKKEEFGKSYTGVFYYLVVFDNKDNAVFPTEPLTAVYGINIEPMKHIKAIYEYNRRNGYSKLSSYSPNYAEGVSSGEDI